MAQYGKMRMLYERYLPARTGSIYLTVPSLVKKNTCGVFLNLQKIEKPLIASWVWKERPREATIIV